MTRDPEVLLLGCRCGHVHGVANEVAPDSGFRFVCYCQTLTHVLERPDVLDIARGTDIFHVPTGRAKLTAGSLCFSRWYTDCCRTPIGNTARAALPGPHSFFHEPRC
jgi:hypothetical protein